ncbi:MAG: cytochrome c [Cyclobacteriaceae bacterium]|jgi:mono/diheme cytochrome c family protein|nr:cytochrome c [Cyclobacteriaceae bacterium]
MKKVNFLLLAVSSIIFLSFQQKQDDLKASMERGKEIYQSNCITCHMDQGEGIEGIFPPLTKSDYMLADKKRAINQILYGASGEMTVNGTVYNGEMMGYELTDEQMSDLMNYIFNSFDNKGGVTTPADVKSARKK